LDLSLQQEVKKLDAEKPEENDEEIGEVDGKDGKKNGEENDDDQEENDEETEGDALKQGKKRGRPAGSTTQNMYSNEEIMQQIQERILIVRKKYQTLGKKNSSEWLQLISGNKAKLLLLDPFFDDEDDYTVEGVSKMLTIAAPLMADTGVAVLMGKEIPISNLIAHFQTKLGKKALKALGTILYYTII